MDDLCIIEADLFREYRILDINPANNAHIEAILLLDCFNGKITIVPRGKYNNSVGHASNVVCEPKRKMLSYAERMTREVTSNLNKLNGNNMDVITRKIKKLIDENNAYDMCNIVLQKSCTSGSYYVQYMCLAESIIQSFPVIGQKCINDFSSRFIDDFDNNMSIFVAINYVEYDQYCIFVKEKAKLLMTLTMILGFGKDKRVYFDVLEFFRQACSHCNKGVQVHIQDMIIEVAAIFVDVCSCQDILSVFTDMYTEVWEHFISKKSKFIVQDIYASLQKKTVYQVKKKQ
jgi:hypothetical protein